ncbi:unnamed protein product [Boreogadus saida]
MNAFLDKDRTMPFIGNLYPLDHRPGQYYVDEGLMVAATIHTMDCTCTAQTLFIIHLMGIHLAVEGEGPAKTFDDLNRRMRLGKRTKKLLWEEMAAKLSTQFGEDFHPDKCPMRPRGHGSVQRSLDELVAYLQSSDEERADALKWQEDFMKDTLREMREDRRELLTQFTRMVDKM